MAGALEKQPEDEATREEGKFPVQTEPWRTGSLACDRACNPLLVPEPQGHRPEKQHTHFTVMQAYTHIVEKHESGQRHSAYMISVTRPSNARGAPSMCQAVCGHLHWFQISPREVGSTRRACLGCRNYSGECYQY